MVGTCGVYPNRTHEIGTAILGSEVGLSYGVAAMGLGYVPMAPKPVTCAAWPALDDVLPTAKILTTGAITTDDTLAARLSDVWDGAPRSLWCGLRMPTNGDPLFRYTWNRK